MPAKLKLRASKAGKLSKGAQFAKIKWDTNKHKRDQLTGRFVHKPGSEEFKAETYGPGKTSNVKSTDVIKLHVTSNPKKPGSNSADRFAHYKDGMTVGEFKALGGKPSDLSNDTQKGFITIHDPATLPKGPPLAEPEPPPLPKLSVAEYAITGKTANFQPHDKIKILVGHNPKKPGSMAAEAFAKYKDEMTVAEFYAAEGGKKNAQSHLLWDTKKGFISVHNPSDLADMQTGKLSPGVLAAQMKGGDKALGVVTKNPFTPGNKNYDDFEATAKQEGLITQAAVTAKVDPATGETKPKLADLDDDDNIISQYGTNYKVSDLKSNTDPVFKQEVDNHLAAGKWTVSKKPPKVADTDTFTMTQHGVTTTYTGAQLKAAGETDVTINQKLTTGKMMQSFGSTPAGGPGVVTMKAGVSVAPPKPGVQPQPQQQPPAPPVKPPPPAPAPLPKQNVEDDDLLESTMGNQYTVTSYKQMWMDNGQDEAGAINKLNQFLAAGSIKVIGKSKFLNDDVVETFMGNKYTFKEYKKKYPQLSDKDISEQLQNGDIFYVPKPPPPAPKPPTVDELDDTDAILNEMGDMVTTGAEAKALGVVDKASVNDALAKGTWKLEAKAAPVKKLMLADVPKSEYKDWDVATITADNPYPSGSEAWVKFKKIHNTSSGAKSMTVEKYLSSTTNVANQEKILDQMVADGHVKFVTPAHKKAVEAQKLKVAQQAAANAKQAQVSKYAVHYQTIKPADYANDPKWGKVPGIQDITAPGKVDMMEQTRVAAGLKFHDRHSHEAVAYYTGSGHSPINDALRHGGGFAKMTGVKKSYAKYLDSIMEPTKGDVIMWRGVGQTGGLNDMPPPSGYTDLAYSSTSHNPQQAQNFAGRSSVTGNIVLFRVRIPAGTNAAFISRKSSMSSAMADEAEIITQRGTRYKYISTTENVEISNSYGGKKIDIVEVEVVDQTGAPWVDL